MREIAVIAEGVETRSEMEVLIAEGVDYLQGYYIGTPQFEPAPLPAKVLEEIRACQRGHLEQ